MRYESKVFTKKRKELALFTSAFDNSDHGILFMRAKNINIRSLCPYIYKVLQSALEAVSIGKLHVVKFEQVSFLHIWIVVILP